MDIVQDSQIWTPASAAGAELLNLDLAALAAHPQSIVSRLQQFCNANQLPTTELLLPLLFRFQGKPITLSDNYHFSPLFRTHRPKEIVFKCGRQLGKSFGLGLDGVTLAAMIPFFSTLYLTPLYEQIRRFSTLVVRPFIADSPVAELWVGSNVEKSVLQRTFRNGSRMMFSFAASSADRTRGLSVHRVCFDEVQDMDISIIPIVKETMSADKKYGLMQFSGTPKTTDGPLEKVWKASSQAEWWIPCLNCCTGKHPTYNIPSLEYHAEKMLRGKLRADISEASPAIICHKCGHSLFPRLGFWKHRYPDRIMERAGYHIPQIITPLHCTNPSKWADLLSKQMTSSPAVFANEVLGESKDIGQKIISKSELEAACCLPWDNKPDDPDPKLMERLLRYTHRILAVDWGGGGEHGFSYTVISLVCRTPEGKIEVPWAKRLLGNDHIADAQEVVAWLLHFRCHRLAHDYTGAGTLRETILLQAQLPFEMTFPVTYVRSAVQDLIVPVKPTQEHHRVEYRVDKTKSIHMTIASIRLGITTFFKYDGDKKHVISLIDDFLNLIENRPKIEGFTSGYRVIASGTGPDDFAQSVNIGHVAMWDMTGEYPHFADEAGIRIDPELVPEEPDFDLSSEMELGIDDIVF